MVVGGRERKRGRETGGGKEKGRRGTGLGE